MQKVIRTVSGDIEELEKLNEMLSEGWEIIANISVPGFIMDNRKYYLPYVEYVLEKEVPHAKRFK